MQVGDPLNTKPKINLEILMDPQVKITALQVEARHEITCLDGAAQRVDVVKLSGILHTVVVEWPHVNHPPELPQLP